MTWLGVVTRTAPDGRPLVRIPRLFAGAELGPLPAAALAPGRTWAAGDSVLVVAVEGDTAQLVVAALLAAV